MCTAIIYKNFFGRNLDLEYSYQETITITPRNFPFHFHALPELKQHHAIIGVAYVAKDDNGKEYPLYYDAINEKGLGVAGLNFVGNAKFFPMTKDKDNVTPYELIPYLLGTCASVKDAKECLSRLSLLNIPFSAELPLSDLHWLIADSEESIVVESTINGLQIYDNPVGVLTNNPPFPAQLFQLNNYAQLSSHDPKNLLAPNLTLSHYSRGLGSRGVPGGLDSQSRFVRVAFTKLHSLSGTGYSSAPAKKQDLSDLSQFFHILHSVDQQRGCAIVSPKMSQAPHKSDSVLSEITIYSSGYDLKKSLAYYTSYDNHQISCVNLKKANLASKKLKSYPLLTSEHINYQN